MVVTPRTTLRASLFTVYRILTPLFAPRRRFTLHTAAAMAPTPGISVADIPKVELHAHLGGSIRPATIDELMRAKGLAGLSCNYAGKVEEGNKACAGDEDRMQHCFKMFDAIYKVTDNLDAFKRITKEVIEDYSAENTKYLELRTSLKRFEGTTESEYLQVILDAIAEANHALPEDKRVTTQLLVSINRGRDVAAAEVATRTALEFKGRGVVGMDFSGNCYKNKWSDFLPCLERARQEGLRSAVHAAEKDDVDELNAMLDFAPGRIGHFVFSDPATRQRVRDMRVPIEMCITSNLITSNWHPEKHHIKYYHDNHPISVNTDDRGVFDITLTSELELFQQLTGSNTKRVFEVSRDALEHAFAPADVLAAPRRQFAAFEKAHLAEE